MVNKITFLGHSAFKIVTSKGLKIFIDPFITGNPACPEECQDDTDADLVLVTHGHGDHLGDTERIMKNSDAVFAGIYELATWVGEKIGDPERVIGYSKGGTIDVKGVKATMFNAIHSSGINELEGFSVGGAETGFIIQLEDGTLIYHAGDTDVFMDMQLLEKLFDHNIDLAMLPIGGHFTMDPKRAALAAELIKPKQVFPIHYGTWPLLVGTPDQFRAELDKVGLKDVGMIAVKPGESFEV
jgi:L-ascorbate metabolism protein UlaG (beta-lactamase superfamily)